MKAPALAVILALAAALPAAAQQTDVELAKKLANPIGSLISVPFQHNYDHNLGLDDAGQRLTVNAQPVVPISVAPDWDVISRTILPITWQQGVVPGAGTQVGLGDTVQSLFLSPKETGDHGIIWGAGPVALLPTATDDTLGSEKFGLGPTAVALTQSGPWTVGVLGNHIWSVAGAGGRRDVNSSFVQPLVSYTTKGATTFSLTSEITYDWERDQAAIPVNAVINQLFSVGGQRMQVGAGLRYWVDAPEGGPEGFGARLNLVFLFPR